MGAVSDPEYQTPKRTQPVSDLRSDTAKSNEDPVKWAVSQSPVDYQAALAAMEARVRQIKDGTAPEMVWLLEHPALYTAGTGAKAHDLLNPDALPVYWTGRGGQFTYHGPGQRVVYVMMDLKTRFGGDVGAYTRTLERWLISTLAIFDVSATTRAGKTGVWIAAGEASNGPIDAKIAAIGLRIRHGISFHGVSINVDPNLAHYNGIVPCGLAGSAVTSLSALGKAVSMWDVDRALKQTFAATFGVTLSNGGASVL